MKRKHLSFICILLVLCMLLSSCGAASALQPPFLKLLTDSVGGFFSSAKNLLHGNTPLIIKGEVKYRVETDGSCPEAVASLMAAIQEKTGCDLASNKNENAKKIRIGLDLSTAVTAASYYIGFSNDDLLITAVSDVMLTEAVRYFESAFVTGEKANCGNGYLYVAGDLDCKGETIQLIGDDSTALYNVVYPKDADKGTFAAVTQLIGDVRGASGVNLTIQDNYFQTTGSPDAKEILIGLTTREESIEATNKLDESSYYLGIEGNKIIITAKNSYMLQKAVERFSELFITNEKADASYDTHSLKLPARLSHTHREEILLLCKDSVSDYTLIYPSGADPRLQAAVQEFQASLRFLTGATMQIQTDAQRPESNDGQKEILIGKTNRHASALAGAGLGAAEWTVTAAGERLVVNAGSLNPLTHALSALFEELAVRAEQQNGKDKENPNAPMPLLCLPASFQMSGANAPNIPSQTAYEPIGDNAYMLYRTECTAQTYTEYINTLKACGYTYHDGRTLGAVTSATYYNDREILNVSFATTDNILRVCVDPRSEAALQPLVAAPHKGRTNVEPLFIQLNATSADRRYGMSYVIRLCDGTFIVVDGGTSGIRTNISNLLSTLRTYSPSGEKPVISCWIFTTPSANFNSNFINNFSAFKDNYELKSVLFSFPSVAQLAAIEFNSNNAAVLNGTSQNSSYTFRGRIAQLGDNTVFYKARTGQRLRFAGCEIETLFTFEDHAQPKTLASIRDASVAFRLSLSDGKGQNSQSVLFMGDANIVSTDVMTARYGNALKSDAIVIAQSNSAAGTDEFYNAVAAPVVFWTCAEKNYTNSAWAPSTRKMLKQSYAKVLYVSGKGMSVVKLTQIKSRTVIENDDACIAT